MHKLKVDFLYKTTTMRDAFQCRGVFMIWTGRHKLVIREIYEHKIELFC